MELKIFLDLDGVIYNWIGSAIKTFNIDYKKNIGIFKRYHDSVVLIKPELEVLKTIEDLGSSYWENLELFPWAKKLYESLNEISNVTILTSPGYWKDAGAGKAISLKRDFGIDDFILTKNKEVCASPNSILIDDKKLNVSRFRKAGGWSYLWPNSFCIEDNEPSPEKAIEDCISYVKCVKSKIQDRQVGKILETLSHDNNKEEDLSE